MKTYRLEQEMYTGYWYTKFHFNADNDQDAFSKAYSWARYNGMTRDDIRATKSTSAAAEAEHNLRNDCLR